MSKPIKKVVIVGGGSAGWLIAGRIAAEHNIPSSVEVTLIESPDIPSIGVGEGTWPSMRNTLEQIGIPETTFIQQCDVSFKQGSKFVGWTTGNTEDIYYHPFMTPDGYGHIDLQKVWQNNLPQSSFADAINVQSHLCEKGIAPKQATTPDYAAVTNYGYHLDANKFATLLHSHCTSQLNVKHIIDHMIGVESSSNGDIAAIKTQANGNIEGDLFIDCTGSASLLLGKHFGIPFINKTDILFNNKAIATQVPYPLDNPSISSTTHSTAQSAGWIWDIALPTRRGVGYTYSSKYIDDATAEEELRAYISQSIGEEKAASIKTRVINFTPGHREKFWHKNCLAVGMSSGFIEPLEASALAMVELSCNMLIDEFPVNREHMKLTANRFNEKFTYRWERTIEFLKLHYVLSKRIDSQYWLDNKDEKSIPSRLLELIALWKYQPPSRYDLLQNEEIFSSASYQYILYGMGFTTHERPLKRNFDNHNDAKRLVEENKVKVDKFSAGLPTNRELINYICQKEKR